MHEQTRVDAPSSVARNRGYSFTVSWGNDGLNDIAAPLLLVGNSVPFGSEPGSYELGTRYSFLGTSSGEGPAGILRRGQGGTRTFFSFSDNTDGTHTVFVDRDLKQPSLMFDYSRVNHIIESLATSPTDRSAILAVLALRVGKTNQEVHNSLGDIAARYAATLPTRPSLNDLFRTMVAEVALPGQSTVRLDIEPNSVVRPGDRVLFQNLDTGARREATIDTHLRLTVVGLPEGVYSVGGRQYTLQFGGSDYLNVDELTVHANAQVEVQTEVRVRVVDSAGQLIKDARVSIVGEDGQGYFVEVNSEGLSIAHVRPPQTITLLATAPGRGIRSITISVGNEPFAATVVISQPGGIRGNTPSEKGDPSYVFVIPTEEVLPGEH